MSLRIRCAIVALLVPLLAACDGPVLDESCGVEQVYDIVIGSEALTDEFGALQLRVEYVGHCARFAEGPLRRPCFTDLEGVLVASNSPPGTFEARFAIISIDGFSAQGDFVRCRLLADENLGASDFRIEVVDAQGADLDPAPPEVPDLEVLRIELVE